MPIKNKMFNVFLESYRTPSRSVILDFVRESQPLAWRKVIKLSF